MQNLKFYRSTTATVLFSLIIGTLPHEVMAGFEGEDDENNTQQQMSLKRLLSPEEVKNSASKRQKNHNIKQDKKESTTSEKYVLRDNRDIQRLRICEARLSQMLEEKSTDCMSEKDDKYFVDYVASRSIKVKFKKLIDNADVYFFSWAPNLNFALYDYDPERAVLDDLIDACIPAGKYQYFLDSFQEHFLVHMHDVDWDDMEHLTTAFIEYKTPLEVIQKTKTVLNALPNPQFPEEFEYWLNEWDKEFFSASKDSEVQE